MEPNALQVLTVLLAIVATIISVYTSIRKLPNELRSGDVDLAQKYMKMANEEAAQRLIDSEELKKLKEKILLDEKKFNKKMEEYETRLTLCAEKADKFEEYSKRLCAQLISLRHVPVPLDPNL
jgi:hypothetical protein